jgi:nitroimidazol reductase NimA-like FMN-containing flavoprotein (pyridoxamine 5'-phosphate oxidase superfamily)
MTATEMGELLQRVGFGHLGCTRDGHPYVVPMHYGYDHEHLYFLTTEGTKTDYFKANAEVCFQVEEVADNEHWRSVMVIGKAEKLYQPDEMARALQLIAEHNPSLTPALSQTKLGAWRRQNRTVTYRIGSYAMYGRRSTDLPNPACSTKSIHDPVADAQVR